MNRDWARERLTRYVELLDAARNDGPDRVKPELRRRQVTVQQILSAIDPQFGRHNFDIESPSTRNRAGAAIERALGVLEDEAEVTENLGPRAPALRADRFHPWVWEAARTYWGSRHFRVAVDAAARSVNSYTQTKVGRRDLYNDDLMNHVFSEKPKPGQSYLRIPGDPTDVMIKNRSRALRPFAQGCFAGIRNLAAHEHEDDWPEQLALESLAALSILARWIDECEVVAVDDSPTPAAS